VLSNPSRAYIKRNLFSSVWISARDWTAEHPSRRACAIALPPRDALWETGYANIGVYSLMPVIRIRAGGLRASYDLKWVHPYIRNCVRDGQ
jgi:hypothetical protein